MPNYLISLIILSLSMILTGCNDSASTSTALSDSDLAPTKTITKDDTKAIVSISNDWVRATHAGQTVGAAYMTLTSQVPMTLVAVKADVTNTTEIHSMSMDNGVMKMRQLKTLRLAPNEAVALAPGGFHLMLFDLAKPLVAGEKVAFDLVFALESGEQTTVALVSTVKDDIAADSHAHHHH